MFFVSDPGNNLPARNVVGTFGGQSGGFSIPRGVSNDQFDRMLRQQHRAHAIRYHRNRMAGHHRAVHEALAGPAPGANQGGAQANEDEGDAFHGFEDDEIDDAMMEAAGVQQEIDPTNAGYGADNGTGGGNAQGQELKAQLMPFYKGIRTGPLKFFKRYHLRVPVFQPFALGTNTGATRRVFYAPGIYVFDPNEYGWYFSQTDLNFLSSVNRQANLFITGVSQTIQIDNANTPFNTSSATQSSANSQLHLKILCSTGLDKLGSCTKGTVNVFNVPATGPYTVSNVSFDNTQVSRLEGQTTTRVNYWQNLDRGRTVTAGTNIATTNGIVAVTVPDATEGYRDYPQIFLWESSWDNTTKELNNYPEFGRTMQTYKLGSGLLYQVHHKKNHLMANQFYDQRISNRDNNITSSATVQSSFSGSISETVMQLQGKTASLSQSNYALDNNYAKIGDALAPCPVKCANPFYLQVVVPPTTSEDVSTGQAGYIALTVDSEVTVDLSRDAINTTTNTGTTWASTHGHIYKFTGDLGLNGSDYGPGAGVTASDNNFTPYGHNIFKGGAFTNV